MKGFGLNPYNRSQMIKIRPFFNYFGGKYRATRLYPKPSCNTIIEPFAGAAGYSTWHFQRDVFLYDVDECVCGVWDFLIHAKPSDILRLPAKVEDVNDVQACQEARWLIGYWIRFGAVPSKTPSPRTKKGSEKSWWSKYTRDRIALQCKYIRHWKITNLPYERIPNRDACWFIDPPYTRAGYCYKHHDIDYPHLAGWCKERRGQVIVCEEQGADWLPFRPFAVIKSNNIASGKSKSPEAIWYKRQ